MSTEEHPKRTAAPADRRLGSRARTARWTRHGAFHSCRCSWRLRVPSVARGGPRSPGADWSLETNQVLGPQTAGHTSKVHEQRAPGGDGHVIDPGMSRDQDDGVCR